MPGECFACVEPASNRYTVVLEGSNRLGEKVLCERCVSELREEEWIKIHDGSTPVIGGERVKENEPDSTSV